MARPATSARSWGRALRPILAASVLLGLSSSGLAAPTPPAPTARVTDGSGVLSQAVRGDLERQLAEHEARTGQQVLLWIGRGGAGASIEEFAARAFAAWRVGRRGLDDGVVIFALTDERRLRIEVGYGLEPRLTDAAAARILREIMVPRLARGDWDGAAREGVTAVLRVLGQGAGAPPGGSPASDEQPAWWQITLGMLGVATLLLLFLWRPSLMFHILFTLVGSSLTGGGSSRRGGGPAGFRGGGGRSGGGGASARW